jgi:hypothetical protein
MKDRSKSLAEVEQCVASTVGQGDNSFKTFKKVEVKWRTLTISWCSKLNLVDEFLNSLTRKVPPINSDGSGDGQIRLVSH